ncbi:MAG: RluA family pseudouridine synthase [Saprospirales bacterium]|nr:RluA family pseudouridine synthase [Saprospirales bacterium]MBK8492024.1 RluA family pseudouridine synthase [Saprospirales bacterium]
MNSTQVNILFEDTDLIIVEKPASLLSIPDRFVPEKENLLDKLREGREEVFTVHRLDRETSGIMIFAKTREAHRDLSLQFENRQVTKQYLVLVEGQVAEEEGRIDLPIGEHISQPGKMEVKGRGKPSLTLYKVLERFKGFTLLEADIQTGRTHQIRVHFAAIGHPLAVDTLYGGREGFLLSEIKGRRFRLGKFEEERPLMTRVTLHAHRLRFRHPTSGAFLEFESPWPKDFGAVVNQLRKWALLSPKD